MIIHDQHCTLIIHDQHNTDKNDTLLDISLNDTYFTTQEVNQSFNKNKNKTFFSMCLNIRSLVNPHNFNKLECLISELQIKPDIIAINETWEKPSSSGQYKNLNGYNFISNLRLNSKGGGCNISIKELMPDDQKIDAIVNMPPPIDVPSLQRFLGMTKYLSQYIPNESSITAPLRKLLKKILNGLGIMSMTKL